MPALLRSLPARRALAQELVLVEECDSTHQVLRDLVQERADANAQLPPSTLVVTEHQIDGRGRRGPGWWSGSKAQNIALSLMLPSPSKPAEAIGLHAACAVADVLRPHLSNDVEIGLKWPNDIFLAGAKVGGLLVEVSELHGQSFALIGLGLNLLQAPPRRVAPYPMAAVANFTPAAGLDRTQFVASWLWAFEKRLRWAEKNDHRQLERDFLGHLRNWAPHGVLDPASGHRGPLVEFSVQRGLTWGQKGDLLTQPLGWIPTLEALPAAT